MPAFGPGQTIVTTDPFVQVDPLPAGTYRFQLEAVDASGNVSAPAQWQVVVVPPQPVPQPQPQPTGPILRPGTIGGIGRIPIQPVVERPTNIPIFKRPVDF